MLILCPYLFVIAAILLAWAARLHNLVPLSVALALLSLPLALRLVRIGPEHGSEIFSLLDGKTAQVHTAFGILLVAGFLLGKLLPA